MRRAVATVGEFDHLQRAHRDGRADVVDHRAVQLLPGARTGAGHRHRADAHGGTHAAPGAAGDLRSRGVLAVAGAARWRTRGATSTDASPRSWCAVRCPIAIVGAIIFGAIALGQIGTTTAGFADQSAPTGTDSAAGDTLVSEHYGSANLNATEFLFKFATPIWSHADDLQTHPDDAWRRAAASPPSNGPLTFSGQALTPAQLVAVHDGGNTLATAALARFVSADGRTVQYIGGRARRCGARRSARFPALRTLADRAGASVQRVSAGRLRHSAVRVRRRPAVLVRPVAHHSRWSRCSSPSCSRS